MNTPLNDYINGLSQIRVLASCAITCSHCQQGMFGGQHLAEHMRDRVYPAALLIAAYRRYSMTERDLQDDLYDRIDRVRGTLRHALTDLKKQAA